MNLLIRNESDNDNRRVEEITREAFWDLYVPGCDEHYLAHVLRNHPDFLPELDFVAIVDEQIVGNIMYAKSQLINEEGTKLDSVTFGPISVLPEFQNKGVGSALIQHSIEKAISQNYKVIVIEGHPHNYCKHGFVGSKSVGVSNSEGKYPLSLLVFELEKGCLQNHTWKYYPSNVYNLDKQKAEEFDKKFPPKERFYRYTQEEFRIASNAFVE